MTFLIPLSYLAGAVYAVAVLLLALYGLHSLWLLALFLRHRKVNKAIEEAELAIPLPADLPHVLIQLPVFNERDVITRLLEAIGRIDWPKDRLTIQLLDDSTDDSVEIGRAACARLAAQGFAISSIHRIDRRGFKAGALENGMKQCDAPFIAIFDADFVPEPDFLKRAIRPLLTDPGLALVQGRWEHLNRNDNILTSAQSLGIDGHFAIEQGARAWSGLAMNFNGTCGLWRRQAIIEGGGWEHDTLTEDMDLSYRAQLNGWHCTYRLGLAVPGEVPADIAAWRSQQFRWAKGSVQTALKLLPRVWRSAWSLHNKVGATLHMTHYFVHPLILISLFAAPFALMLVERTPTWVLMCGFGCFLIGASAPIATYIASQFVLYQWKGLRNLRQLPILAAIGTGIAVSNAMAVWQALIGKESPFVRTPKAGGTTAIKKVVGSYKARGASGMAELFCAGWAALTVALGLTTSHTWITPLLILYFSGFLWMAVLSIADRYAGASAERPSPWPLLVPAGAALIAGAFWTAGQPAPWSLHNGSILFGAAAMAAAYGVGLLAVRQRPGNRGTLLWIVLVAVVARLALWPMVASPDTYRAVVEGRQAAAGINPYLHAPADLASAPVNAALPTLTLAALEDPDLASTNGPVTVAYARLMSAFSSDPRLFKGVGLLLELVVSGMLLTVLVRTGQAPGTILLAAWNPLPIMFIAGGGRPEVAGMALLAIGLYLLAGSHQRRGTAAIALAAAATPAAATTLLPALLGERLRLWVLAGAVLVATWLPFSDAGTTLLRTLAESASRGGVLPPLVHSLLAPLVPAAQLGLAVALVLACVLVAGLWLILARTRRGAVTALPSQALLVLVVGLACMPGLQPWHLLPVAMLLPFAPSAGLALWTVVAPCAPLIADPAWAALIVHIPPLALATCEGLTGFDFSRFSRRVPATA
jgi:cellulose synthase/poly-beta-1,6-N-acetylglucosamine synthase-like glycosyltransferase